MKIPERHEQWVFHQEIPERHEQWVFHQDTLPQKAADGVTRRVLAYTDQLMCVENHFEKGAVGSVHSHPHTQITYVVSGAFEFTIGDQTKIVRAGDSLLKEDGVRHGCVCLEKGILLDIFNRTEKNGQDRRLPSAERGE